MDAYKKEIEEKVIRWMGKVNGEDSDGPDITKDQMTELVCMLWMYPAIKIFIDRTKPIFTAIMLMDMMEDINNARKRETD